MVFGDAERYIKSLFLVGENVNYNNKLYRVLLSGKPTISYGEPKTDVYVLLENDEEQIELKISIKKGNADFIENKINSERAEIIFGRNWFNIIRSSTLNIERRFYNKPLVYKRSYGSTDEGSITLGWKFELVNKANGELSGYIKLSREQLLSIYAGTDLPYDKRHAYVDRRLIHDSGVANFILYGDLEEFDTVDQVLVNLIPINEYIEENPDIYFACKALNYRTYSNRFDGDRPLAVYVDWENIDNKLCPSIIFDNPLMVKGNEVKNKLMKTLSELEINDTNDINEYNVSSTRYIFE